jgi:hypothetical protein
MRKSSSRRTQQLSGRKFHGFVEAVLLGQVTQVKPANAALAARGQLPKECVTARFTKFSLETIAMLVVPQTLPISLAYIAASGNG